MMSRKLAWVLALTATFLLVEIIGGIVSNSLALLADAGHMATDVAALALAWFGARIAQRRQGSAHQFGNLRWEVLAAMVNGIALFAIGIGITREAYLRLNAPREIDAVLFGGIAAVGLVVNLISLRVLHGHHHHDLNVRGAYLHIMSDVLGSVGAIIAALVIHFYGWVPADAIISVLVAALILRSAWRLVKESGTILLDRVPGHLQVSQLEERLLGVAGVTRVHDVHVWTVTSGLIAMSAHAVVPALDAHPTVLRQIEGEMTALGIGHVTIQLETGEACGAEQCGHEDHGVLAVPGTAPHRH
jgi:cobalt-zinc-cadmium efflux system protein